MPEPNRCIYCQEPTDDGTDEHAACVERSIAESPTGPPCQSCDAPGAVYRPDEGRPGDGRWLCKDCSALTEEEEPRVAD